MGDPQTGGQSFQRSFHTVVTLLGPTPDLPNVWKDELMVVQSLGKWKDKALNIVFILLNVVDVPGSLNTFAYLIFITFQ